MKNSFYLLLPLSLALVACERTERTNPEARRPHAPAAPAAEQITPAPPAEATPATPAAEPPAPAAPAPATPPAAPPASDALLVIRATQQGYSPLQPWEKTAARSHAALGVLLENGQVLTVAEAVKEATYVELALPDESRSVPARVQRRDDDLNLALLEPLHEADKDIFASRSPLSAGEPLAQGAEAELAGLVGGLTPVRIPLLVQGCSGQVPQLSARMNAPLPEGHREGAPVMRAGKLAGLSAGYSADTQTLSVINADLLTRFLADTESAGTPVLGLQFTELDDPVLRRYLRLGEGQTGLYVSRVLPHSAALAAGLQTGDVITAVEGMPLDSRGRVHHPLYGPLHAASALRILKQPGDTLALTVSRDGETRELAVELNREAEAYGLHSRTPADSRPRYILWGGLLFQPLTADYLDAVRARSNGDLPLSYLRLTQQNEPESPSAIREHVGLTLVIPTPAALGYEEARFSVVTAVNGKPVHDFAEFERLLDEPTEDGLVSLSIDRAPYTLHLDRAAAEAANDLIRRRGIPSLRVTEQAGE